jgi:hypothetical protein
MDAVTVHHVVAISGDQIADVSAWDCFRNGENKEKKFLIFFFYIYVFFPNFAYAAAFML